MKLDDDDIDAIAEAVVERLKKRRLKMAQALSTPIGIALWIVIIIGIITALRECVAH